jgi:lipid-A-disaccharide synthase
MTARGTKVAMIAGEASGDALGASFIKALRRRMPDAGSVELTGVGGEAMAGEGFESLFPQSDIAVMGLLPVIKRLPTLLRRMRDTARHIIAAEPDVVLTIDSPDFCLRVAKQVRAAAPHIPIVHWVCPSVWAWRPARARRMQPHVDKVLCLLPFEPRELERLAGPRGVYVGHPLIEQLDDLRPLAAEQPLRADASSPLILVLPGSRGSEISHHLDLFGVAIAQVAIQHPAARFAMPVVPHLADRIRKGIARWPVKPVVVADAAAKLAAFRQARVALAASGTVTLELALAGVPTVATYRVSEIEAAIARRLLTLSTVILPNLILGRNAVPEFLQENATAEKLVASVLSLLPDGATRRSQITAFAEIEAMMRLSDSIKPSDMAVNEVLAMISKRQL